MKQTALIILFTGILAASLSGLIPIPKSKSNLPQPAPLQNAKLLVKNADLKGDNLQLANFELIGQTTPVCQTGGKLAIDLLLDTSTSMTCENSKGACKINSLKSAVNNFIDKLPDTSLIGIQTLQGNLVATDKLSTLGKDNLKAQITKIKPIDGTPTAKGLQFSKVALDDAKTKFPDYGNRVLVLLTDGCPDGGQKPLPIASEIKNDGVRIITIGLELGGAGKCNDGYAGAVKLMEGISSPGDYIDSDSAALDKKFSDILTKTASCGAAKPVCIAGEKPAVDMLVDVSGSMEPHIDNLRTALTQFGTQFKDTDILGMQTFSGGGSKGIYHDVLPINTMANNRSKYNDIAGSISEDQEGWTYMRQAMSQTKDKIDAYTSIPDYKKWALIFLSDGFPQTKTSNGAYDNSQDPTTLIESMKAKGMRIVSIALGNKADRGLMKKLASNEANDYFDATTAGDLSTIYSRIFQSFTCE